MYYGIIYLLRFTGTNKVYIGQTTDPTKRKAQHIALLNKGIHTKKLQDAYNTYGEPEFIKLIEASSYTELCSLEEEAIKVWDSFNNGFNTKHYVAGREFNSCGELNGNSKYSNEEIIQVFLYLVNNKDIPITKVSEVFCMPLICVYEITEGKKHVWLKEIYPEEYALLMSYKGTRKKFITLEQKGIVHRLISPDGIEYTIKDSVRAFCREHSLNNTSIGNVINGKAKQHKGWVKA